MIGETAEGPFAIDLVTDGPHGLVAGTTGSGKSELLQTLIGSLAADNRPDEMTFVLIDYKGVRRSRTARTSRTPSAWSRTSTGT